MQGDIVSSKRGCIESNHVLQRTGIPSGAFRKWGEVIEPKSSKILLRGGAMQMRCGIAAT